MKKVGVGSSNENGPKQRVQTRRLGHKYVYFILFRTNYVFLLYLGTRMVQVGGDSKKGPKWRVKTCRLGNKYVFFYLFSCSCILTIFDYYI
jgi:hypothetical protein